MSEKELRELDAWIAEHVMGWLRVANTDRLDHINRFYVLPDRVLIGENMGNRITTFSPTTDPAAAMQVLEKCAEKNAIIIRQQDCGKWCVWHAEIRFKDCCALEDSLPLAICLFAKQLFSK